MREIYRTGATPQQKLVAVNQKFGNTGIKSQQGTTRELYDTLPYSGLQQTYRFFEDSASRNFPLTNTGSDGNKLGVGDSMVISAIQFTFVEDKAGYGIQAFNALACAGDLSFEIANNRVIKNLALTEGQVFYSEVEASGTKQVIIHLETEIVIPPLLNFVLELRAPNVGAVTNTLVRCDIIGAAGIIAPRTTF